MRQYQITSNDSNQRLDKFLKKLFPNATLSYIYKLNRKGNIKILQVAKKTKQSNEYKLQSGDIVQVFLSDTDIQKISQDTKNKTREGVEVWSGLSRKDIVFEDEDILVLNKNPWQNVHPGDHATTEVSLIDQVHDYYKNTLDSLTFKPSLAHRIDRDTSGIIMIWKTKQALIQLTEEFKKPSIQFSTTKGHQDPQGRKNELQWIEKMYFCVVLWKLSRNSGTICKKLKRIENAQRENKVQVSDTWQEAITHYTLIDEYRLELPQWTQIISTLKVTIETGRMHQIRVHMAALWNPILWDKAYGDKKLNSYFAKNFWVTRQMLHAWKIKFTHPITNKKMSLEAKLKKDMMSFIGKLKK